MGTVAVFTSVSPSSLLSIDSHSQILTGNKIIYVVSAKVCFAPKRSNQPAAAFHALRWTANLGHAGWRIPRLQPRTHSGPDLLEESAVYPDDCDACSHLLWEA